MKEIQRKNKHHHFLLKVHKMDKLDLFTNLLKAATDCTSSFVISKLFQGEMTRSQKKFLRKFVRWKLGYSLQIMLVRIPGFPGRGGYSTSTFVGPVKGKGQGSSREAVTRKILSLI